MKSEAVFRRLQPRINRLEDVVTVVATDMYHRYGVVQRNRQVALSFGYSIVYYNLSSGYTSVGNTGSLATANGAVGRIPGVRSLMASCTLGFPLIRSTSSSRLTSRVVYSVVKPRNRRRRIGILQSWIGTIGRALGNSINNVDLYSVLGDFSRFIRLPRPSATTNRLCEAKAMDLRVKRSCWNRCVCCA